MSNTDSLEDWIEREYQIAAREMLSSISATGLQHHRPGFRQSIRPATGSMVASPIGGAYDPAPDYFFHWLRDSAVVMGAVTALIDDGTLGAEGHATIADLVRFSLALDALDGRQLAADPDYGAGVAPEFRRYLRPREEMAGIHGDRIRMEARFNPDGTLDIIHWARPQFDGAATRAVMLADYARRFDASDHLRALLEGDLDFSLRYAGAEGYDLWEERSGADYYSGSMQQAALAVAGASADARGDRDRAAEFNAATSQLALRLDQHWSPERSAYLCTAGGDTTNDREVDFAAIFAALHGGRREGRHSIRDPRIQATFATLAETFAADYAINRGRPDAAPAMGRFRGDVYQSGGAYYFSTLAAAEFHYRLAASAAEQPLEFSAENALFLAQITVSPRPQTDMRTALLRRGDAFMETVRHFTPTSGALSEQFDQTDGRQTSAPHLAWSYAAFITATAARRRALTMKAADLHSAAPKTVS